MKDIEFKIGEISSESFEIQDVNSLDFDLGNATTIIENDYEKLKNKPKINSYTLIGDKNGNELNLVNGSDFLTNIEIEELLNRQI